METKRTPGARHQVQTKMTRQELAALDALAEACGVSRYEVIRRTLRAALILEDVTS